MKVNRLLSQKSGGDVETISVHETLGDVIKRLAEKKIGALVVTGAGGEISGIISERDIVRQIASSGPTCLTSAVKDTMTRKVVSAAPDDDGDALLSLMTKGRFRHMPVVEDGRLVGIMSIGDVVKAKIDAITAENEAMESMIRGH